MKKKLVIIGGSGVGMLAASIAKNFYDFNEIIFLNDDKKKKNIGKFQKFKVVGGLDKIKFYINNNNYAVFNAIVDYKNIPFKYKKIQIPKKNQVSLIHPSLNCDESMINLGENILICSNVVLSTDVKINDGVKIMSNVFVGHNTIIEKNAFIAAGSVIGGNVLVSKNSFIGLNSTIIENCQIGEDSILGAGAVLRKNIKNRETFAGNPALKIR